MPETFTTQDARGRDVEHERLTDDELMEQHLSAYEQTATDSNLVRLLRHLGSELLKVRGAHMRTAAASTTGERAELQSFDVPRTDGSE